LANLRLLPKADCKAPHGTGKVPKYKPIEVGPLPAEMINRTLGTEMGPGKVRVSAQARKHIADKHPDDYEVVLANLQQTIAAPTYLGQAPHHADNIELIRRVRLGDRASYVLVAIGLEPDERGSYRVRSGYLISHDTVEDRRRSGRLMAPK
jgi:hypothetical protein